MTHDTALDLAFAQMEANPQDDTARLRFFERLADSELFMLLTREADGDSIEPELFDVADARFVLVFDREERLSGFVGKPAPYVAVSGRAVVSMLEGQGIGLGLNLQVAPSEQLLPPEAVDWLMRTLSHAPDETEAVIEELYAPVGLPEALLTALDAKLATAGGMAKGAYLAKVDYKGGAQGHMLAFVGTRDGAEPALAQAASEALTFSGIDAGMMDVGFLDLSDPRAAAFAKVGLRFDLPEAPEPSDPAAQTRPAPGSDPDKPPRLR